MIEVHPDPAKALSDGAQSLTPNQYQILMDEMATIGQVMGRWLHKVPISTESSRAKTDRSFNDSPHALSF